MKAKQMTQCNIINSVRRTKPVVYSRVTAGLAVVAWLALAGDAFSQSTNQWAPAPAPTPLVAAPVYQSGQTTQVWANTDGGGAPIYAPADLGQRLASPANPATRNTPVYTPPVQAPASAPVSAPVYAPSSLATAGQPPVQQPAVTGQPYGRAPIAPGQGYGYGGYGGAPYGAGYGGLPYGAGYGGLPYGAGYGGYPGATPYGAGYGGYPGATPYGGTGPGYGYPGVGGYPGTGIMPGLGGWGSPNNSYNSYGGIPFFGGSPFGFW